MEERSEFLSYEELTRLIRLFAELGVSHVRLTGGEPLVRRGLVEWVDQIKRLPGIEELSLSSNAHLLAEHAAALKTAGLDRVNISLDSLDPETFRQVTRNGDLKRVLAGIDAALKTGLHPVKLNMVVMKGINHQEIEPMLDYALERGANLRFIETMPIGRAGLDGIEHYYPAATILERVKAHVGAELIPAATDKGAGPARYYRISGSPATVGVISAMSRHFCDGCNRVQLTARGELVLCLGQEDRASLREPLRDGADDQELKEQILAAIARKPKSHDFNEDPLRVATRTMSSLGG
jgi:cyclic pyranopterin phosphate synthase